MYGSPLGLLIARLKPCPTSTLIDPEGKIREIWRNVRVKGHIEDVKKRLRELQG